jgi:hypothetical protein
MAIIDVGWGHGTLAFNDKIINIKSDAVGVNG